MNFTDIEASVQDDIIELLNEHIATSAEIMKDDKCLLPMLRITGEKPDTNQLVSLQPADGNIDVDKAYCFVLHKLKKSPFNLCFIFLQHANRACNRRSYRCVKNHYFYI